MKAVSPEAAKLIEKAIVHLTRHSERLNYASARRGGFHIGSGAIESDPSENESVRRYAALALGMMRTRDAIAALIEIHDRDETPAALRSQSVLKSRGLHAEAIPETAVNKTPDLALSLPGGRILIEVESKENDGQFRCLVDK